MAEHCYATHESGWRCEGEQNHEGPHWFTHYVEWESCWFCGADPAYDSHAPDCEAVIDAIAGWQVETYADA